MPRRSRLWAAICVTALSACAAAALADVPAPPPQPESGPGGSNYPHDSVDRESLGGGDLQYWLFTPAGPKLKSAPVIVFLHGWSAMDPVNYEAWITHLARRGNTVIYPRYQSSRRTRADEFTGNATLAIKDALIRLRKMGPVKPEPGRFALVGHSAGGVICANLAAEWEARGLPRPGAVMCVEPGRSLNPDANWGIPLADYSKMPADALLLCLVGADDRLVGSEISERILAGATRIPWANKNLVTAFTDRHGEPELVANHTFPAGITGSARQVNALDYYACWKLLDGLTDAAFYERRREYALGDTPEQRYMGKWSDGTPVKELQVWSPEAE